MVAIRHKLFSTIMDKNRGSNSHLWVFLKNWYLAPAPAQLARLDAWIRNFAQEKVLFFTI